MFPVPYMFVLFYAICAHMCVCDADAPKSGAKVTIFFDICKYFSDIHKKICILRADLSISEHFVYIVAIIFVVTLCRSCRQIYFCMRFFFFVPFWVFRAVLIVLLCPASHLSLDCRLTVGLPSACDWDFGVIKVYNSPVLHLFCICIASVLPPFYTRCAVVLDEAYTYTKNYRTIF